MDFNDSAKFGANLKEVAEKQIEMTMMCGKANNYLQNALLLCVESLNPAQQFRYACGLVMFIVHICQDIGYVDHFYDFWIQKSLHFCNFWIQK